MTVLTAWNFETCCNYPLTSANIMEFAQKRLIKFDRNEG